MDFNAIAARINELRAEMDRISEIEGTMSYSGNEDKYREVWDKEREIRDQIERQIASLRQTDVIRFLEELSDQGYSPQPALEYWISSWC